MPTHETDLCGQEIGEELDGKSARGALLCAVEGSGPFGWPELLPERHSANARLEADSSSAL